jgi:ketosteroid isomerase-like protein
MSEENVELVRREFELWNRRDVDGALEMAAADIVMDWSNSRGPAKGVHRGKEEVRKFWGSFLEAFDAMQWEPTEIIELNASQVLVVTHFQARGRGSGIEVDASGAQLWTVRDGEVQNVKLFQSKAEALDAAGLPE